jgi:hypothetical protein
MGMASNNGGFFGGLAGGLQTALQQQHLKELGSLFENLNQNTGRPMLQLGQQTGQMQGPMVPMGGVSLRNKMLSLFRGRMSPAQENPFFSAAPPFFSQGE